MNMKTLDSKGRVALGAAFAGQQVIIKETKLGGIEIMPCKAVPMHEAWLYENETALSLVRDGLADAQAGRLTDGPDMDDSWLDD